MDGEQEASKSIEEVEVIGPDGKKLPDDEAAEFLKKLQAGVFYFPQR